MASYRQRVRVRAVNRHKFEDFRENPPLIVRRWDFFAHNRCAQLGTLRGKNMTRLDEKEILSREERLAALAHLYLEMHLSFQGAMEAAAADLVHLDGFELVAEAAQ
jgi:hypothetical protein